MAVNKLYDLVVKVGSYQKDGEEKGRYENVGALMEGEKGKFIFLKKTFNPAGVPNSGDKESIIVSMFKPQGGNSAPAPDNNPPSDDEIPF